MFSNHKLKFPLFILITGIFIPYAHAETPVRINTYECLFNFAEQYASDTVRSTSKITGIQSAYFYRYFDLTDSYLAVNEIDNNVYLYRPSVSSEIGSLGDVDYWLNESGCNNEALKPLASSYENEHERDIGPYHLPNKLTDIYGGHDWLSAVGQADFTQNGEFELVTHSHHAAFSDGFLADGTPFEYGDKSDIRFWRRSHSGENWIEITDTLLKDNKGCMLARKALIADFNNDNKPDVFFACTGHVRTDSVSSDNSDFSQVGEAPVLENEKPIILLSQEGGTYKKEYAADYEAYAHGSAAGDLNGDGFVDVVISDSKKYLSEDCETCAGGKKYTLARGKSLWFLWGNGDGTFDLSDGQDLLPLDVYNEAYKYWAIEIIDIDNDNYLDIWLGGAAEDWILYNDGEGNFKDRIREMPKDERYYESLDAVKIGTNLYVYSINEDYSKPQYYWGDALTKVDLISFSSEIVYEHEGYYRSSGECVYVACRPWSGVDYLDSWFPWLSISNGNIVPLDKAYDVILYSDK